MSYHVLGDSLWHMYGGELVTATHVYHVHPLGEGLELEVWTVSLATPLEWSPDALAAVHMPDVAGGALRLDIARALVAAGELWGWDSMAKPRLVSLAELLAEVDE